MSQHSPTTVRIGAAFRSAQRMTEVAAALARFGFGAVAQELGIGKYLPGGRDRAEGEEARLPLPVRVRLLLEELGPTFVKVGQIASTRADLVPPRWMEEFKKLQSQVPPEPWEGPDGVGAYLRKQYDDNLDEIFEHIEEQAFAAASIAQVHRARLRSGERVVIKALRPGIREQMAADMELLRLLVRLVRSHIEDLGIDPDDAIEEFRRQLERETDFIAEAAATKRMRDDFKDSEGIFFPRIYADISTKSALVLEEIEGDLLSTLDTSTLDQRTRENIVRNGADMVFRQCLVIGFFHADPHPGNMIVLEGGRLCFIDCGMTGLIEPSTKEQIAQITHGAISGNLEAVIRVAIDLSGADPRLADDRAFRADVWRFVDEFHTGTLASIRMGHLLDEFFGVLRRYHMQCPADIVYLIKALTEIEGVGSEVAPEFDLVSYVHPYVERLVKERYSFGAIKDRAQEAAVRYLEFAETLPADLSDLVRSLRQNRLSVRIDHTGLDRLTSEIERASMNISWSLGVAAIIVGASVLVLADSVSGEGQSALTVIAAIGMAIAILLAAARIIKSWWSSGS